MENRELQVLTEKWSMESFHRPFEHQVFFNKRLQTTGGRYHLNDHHIDVNPKMLDEFDVQNLKEVVLHELCHYHLHLMGRDYQHKSPEFKQLLAQVGGKRYAPPVASVIEKRRKLVFYRCQHCGSIISRKRHFNTTRYVCARCRGKFSEISATEALKDAK